MIKIIFGGTVHYFMTYTMVVAITNHSLFCLWLNFIFFPYIAICQNVFCIFKIHSRNYCIVPIILNGVRRFLYSQNHYISLMVVEFQKQDVRDKFNSYWGNTKSWKIRVEKKFLIEKGIPDKDYNNAKRIWSKKSPSAWDSILFLPYLSF